MPPPVGSDTGPVGTSIRERCFGGLGDPSRGLPDYDLEHFCGHGFHNEDPESECYRGPGVERWFDFTCTHPTPAGHRQIADMVLAVIDE